VLAVYFRMHFDTIYQKVIYFVLGISYIKRLAAHIYKSRIGDKNPGYFVQCVKIQKHQGLDNWSGCIKFRKVRNLKIYNVYTSCIHYLHLLYTDSNKNELPNASIMDWSERHCQLFFSNCKHCIYTILQ